MNDVDKLRHEWIKGHPFMVEAFTCNELRQFVCALFPDKESEKMRVVEIVMHEQPSENRVIYNVTERINHGLLCCEHDYDFVMRTDIDSLAAVSVIDGEMSFLKDNDAIALFKSFGLDHIFRMHGEEEETDERK